MTKLYRQRAVVTAFIISVITRKVYIGNVLLLAFKQYNNLLETSYRQRAVVSSETISVRTRKLRIYTGTVRLSEL